MKESLQDQAIRAFDLRGYLSHACVHTEHALQVAESSNLPSYGGNLKELTDFIIHFGEAINAAEIIMWREDIFTAATRGAESFVNATAPQWIEDFWVGQMWYFGGHFTKTQGFLDVPSEYLVESLAVLPIRKGGAWPTEGVIFVYIFTNPSLHEGHYSLPVLRFMPGISAGQTVDDSHALFLAGLEFMRLKLTAKLPVHLPRPYRRRLERENKPRPDINVIQLRRREASGWHTPDGREYHHRWIVKGHWRRLHRPRKKDGAEVTYVESYVKGPDDAPLLPPRESVYAVTR